MGLGPGARLRATAFRRGRPWDLGEMPSRSSLWRRSYQTSISRGVGTTERRTVLAWTRGRNPRLALAVALAWSTHVLFDWLGSDDTPPLGVMALWPLNSTFYFADAFVFEAISRRYWLPNFVSHNAWAVAKETLTLGPLFLLLTALRWRARRRSRPPGTT